MPTTPFKNRLIDAGKQARMEILRRDAEHKFWTRCASTNGPQ